MPDKDFPILRTKYSYTHISNDFSYNADRNQNWNLSANHATFSEYKLRVSTNQYDEYTRYRGGPNQQFATGGVHVDLFYNKSQGQSNESYYSNKGIATSHNLKFNNARQEYGINIGGDLISRAVDASMGIGISSVSSNTTNLNVLNGTKETSSQNKLSYNFSINFEMPILDLGRSLFYGGQNRSGDKFDINAVFNAKTEGFNENKNFYSAIGGLKFKYNFTEDNLYNVSVTLGPSYAGYRGGAFAPDKLNISNGTSSGLGVNFEFNAPLDLSFLKRNNHPTTTPQPSGHKTPASDDNYIDPTAKTPRYSNAPDPGVEGGLKQDLRLSSFNEILKSGHFTEGEKKRINALVDVLQAAKINYKENGENLTSEQTALYNTTRLAILTLADDGDQLKSPLNKKYAAQAEQFARDLGDITKVIDSNKIKLDDTVKNLDITKLSSGSAINYNPKSDIFSNKPEIKK